MVLLGKKRQRKLAIDGASLLRNKREALLAEFMALIKPLLAQRKSLDERTRKALSALAVAMGMDGPEALESAAMASGQDLLVEVKDRKVWGFTSRPYSLAARQGASWQGDTRRCP